MAKFTRAEIRAIIGDSCTDEIENKLVALHLGVVDALKDDLDKYKTDAAKVPELVKKLEEAEKNGEYKTKYEKEHSDFEAYKKSIDAEKTKGAKEKAVRDFFEKKGITGANLDIAMRGAREEVDAVELNGDKITDTKALDALISGTYKGLIVTKGKQGANTANPPANTGGGEVKSREEIYKRDDNGNYIYDSTTRQEMLAELITSETS